MPCDLVELADPVAAEGPHQKGQDVAVLEDGRRTLRRGGSLRGRVIAGSSSAVSPAIRQAARTRERISTQCSGRMNGDSSSLIDDRPPDLAGEVQRPGDDHRRASIEGRVDRVDRRRHDDLTGRMGSIAATSACSDSGSAARSLDAAVKMTWDATAR